MSNSSKQKEQKSEDYRFRAYEFRALVFDLVFPVPAVCSAISQLI